MMDPVTLAILGGRLEQIADEMDATLYRAAFNPIIAEAHDASHGIYDALTGDTLIQGKQGLPIFTGVMAFAVKAVIDKAAADGDLAPGDVYIFNDPYRGGTHLSDFKLVRPVFRDGKLFCWLASAGHYHDVGGNVAGNYNPRATEAFQEAVVIPPVKLFAAGTMRRDILDVMMANTRQPRSMFGDLNGMVNALDLGERRLSELLDQYGDAVVTEGFADMRERARKLMLARIAELPAGTVSAEDFLDNDGVTDTPLRIAVDMTVREGGLTFDFSRSAPACRGPLNISRGTTIAACYVAIKHLFPEIPANGGVLAPIDFMIPEGSILAAEHPMPTGGYTETIMRLIDVIFQAFAQISPERAFGNAYGTINALTLSGRRRDGSRWVMFSFFGGGHGGHAHGDGLSHGNAPISTSTIPPVEVLEAANPVIFRQWALRPDSAGDGAHRGGLGAIYEIETLEDDTEVTLFGERGRHAPHGVMGGGDGACTRFEWDDADGTHSPPMVSKVMGVKLEKGRRIRLMTPGGGGWGAPSDRDPALSAEDIRRGYVTAPQTTGMANKQ
ncbi:hydantoinase B/oxoprolinase family protein [Gemmobacter nectariphilus]|uniref:hydantoinase B/oxoprolinase family protein n=1 Tax=Gemmobacter nectariphilus TaxID=220343 RepID=UPI00040EC152|nr:hydantoinase B/oxoprolinase family protein [Gemmobacter nectariphilus]